MARDEIVTHKIMSAIKSRDTEPELILRRAIWKQGLRYRVNMKNLPGKPDIVFTKAKIAVFCDSEFFHGKDFDVKKKPATNPEYWEEKITRNMRRDQEVDAELKGLGWHVVRFWGRDIVSDPDACVKAVEDIIFNY